MTNWINNNEFEYVDIDGEAMIVTADGIEPTDVFLGVFTPIIGSEILLDKPL